MFVYKVLGGLGQLHMGYLIMYGYVSFTKYETWSPR